MARRRELFIPSIALDRASAIPLQRQIYEQIARAIRDGAIRRESRLPSTRVVARLLAVSRNTISSAYEELVADDLIREVPGAGMWVNGADRTPTFVAFGRMIQAAGYPARVLAFEDVDGNPLYVRY